MKEGLERVGAIEINGCWSLISPALTASTFDVILNYVVQHDMPVKMLRYVSLGK